MKKQEQHDAPADLNSPDLLIDAERITVRARKLEAAEKWAQACRTLRPLAEYAPGAADLWLQIARWEQADGRAEDAAATLRHAIALNQNRNDNLVILWHTLAMHHIEAQQWAQAAEAATEGAHCSRVLLHEQRRARKPADARLWAGGGSLRADTLREHDLMEIIATARAHEGRFEDASDAMRALLSLSPRDPLHRMRLASLLQTHGALGEAAREFERVLDLAPGTFFARDAEGALDLLDKAQIQQILTRAGEQRSFGLRLERDLEGTLDAHSFHLSESGRESLRQMIDDGRPDLSRPPRVQ